MRFWTTPVRQMSSCPAIHASPETVLILFVTSDSTLLIWLFAITYAVFAVTIIATASLVLKHISGRIRWVTALALWAVWTALLIGPLLLLARLFGIGG